MELLKKRILKDGIVINNSILKVDNFLNHQIDTKLFNEIGKEFKRLFEGQTIDKILTIESSGIAVASFASIHFNYVPVVFAKKTNSSIIDENVYTSKVHSFTKNTDYIIRVSKKYIKDGENVLIIDDFLANGCAALGLIEIIEQSGANVAGIGVVIEKIFQGGREKIEKRGYKVNALASIENFDDNKIIFK
ncbi:xanthine phosphoribosyltransferase [Caloramator quimbayensis]|uniref:Xanthine phosphoribosyltransferase n=1 Tax=Caloramator quimbayensis TaxID=1147123 RepID=A0A1T4WJ24_9CLOT|nr:xanthine phosphoribosyltransferase [Caloramator quimbayensis]SKA77333.1 xanthine phosphoribosyltransferase [Caloramator quimbayensis]